jgi:hypothetical protein
VKLDTCKFIRRRLSAQFIITGADSSQRGEQDENAEAFIIPLEKAIKISAARSVISGASEVAAAAARQRIGKIWAREVGGWGRAAQPVPAWSKER